jgi:hypothetical protein
MKGVVVTELLNRERELHIAGAALRAGMPACAYSKAPSLLQPRHRNLVMPLLPFADNQRIGVDETVRFRDVASAFDDDGLAAAGVHARNGDVLPAGLF